VDNDGLTQGRRGPQPGGLKMHRLVPFYAITVLKKETTDLD